MHTTGTAGGYDFSNVMQGKFMGGSMAGIIPHMGLYEFMDKLHKEEYDPEAIYDIWQKLPPELVANNKKCGVCKQGYAQRPTK